MRHKISFALAVLLCFIFAGLADTVSQAEERRDMFKPMDPDRILYRDDGNLNLSLPLANLKEGKYTITLELRKADNPESIRSQPFGFTVVKSPQLATFLQEKPAVQSEAPAFLQIFAIDVNGTMMIGDAYLIISPSGKTMLIDAGYFNYGRNVILPFLKQYGIKTIDYLVCTHPHNDHIGGMADIILSKDITVKNLLWSTIFPSFEEMKQIDGFGKEEQKAWLELHAACRERHLQAQEVHVGQVIDMGGGVRLEILGVAKPQAEADVAKININNHCIVMKLRYRKFTMLFTGDACFEEENRILARGADLTSNILKVGHHAGDGNTSIQWLHAVSPHLAIASMPRRLSFDPRGERVYAELKNANIPFYRTWEYGNIEVQSDGNRFWLMTEKSMKQELPYSSPVVDKSFYQLPLVWQFRTDSRDIGLSPGEWTLPQTRWKPIRVDKDWTTQGFKYYGAAWYTVEFEIPWEVAARMQKNPDRLVLYFGAIDGAADIILDGKWLGEQKRNVAVMWDKAFAVPLPSDFEAAGLHRLTVRVKKDMYHAGIWKPVEIVVLKE